MVGAGADGSQEQAARNAAQHLRSAIVADAVNNLGGNFGFRFYVDPLGDWFAD